MQTKGSILRSFLAGNKWLVVLTFILTLCSSLLTILIPISIGKYYDLMFNYHSQRAQVLDFLPGWVADTIPHFLLFFGALVLFKFITAYYERYLTGMLGEFLVFNIRDRLFKHQLHLNMEVYDQKGIGKYLLRYSGDLKSIQNYFSKGIIGFAGDMVLLMLAVVTMLLVDYRMFIVFVVAIPAILIPVILLNRKLYNVSVDRRNIRSGMLSFVNKRLRGVVSIKAFNKEKPEYNKFERRSRRLLASGIQYHRVSSLIHVIIPTLLYTMLGGILFFAYYQKLHNQLVVEEGTLLTCLLLIITMMPVFRRTFRVVVHWKLGKISFTKLLNVLNLEQDEHQEKTDLIVEDGLVEVKDLSFAYEGNAPLFKMARMTFSPHKTHLVKGGTGVGKTSLIKLLMGIYRPTEGAIFIDGQNIDEVNPRSLRKKVTVVSNDFPLLGKTVFEAVSYSRKPEKRQAAEHMLDRVQRALPSAIKLSLDDAIGDLGNNLSKGQKRILSYTRALLTRKPILILDEPFLGLDEENSKNLARMIEQLKKKRTIIVLNPTGLEHLACDVVYDLNQYKGEAPTVLRKIG